MAVEGEGAAVALDEVAGNGQPQPDPSIAAIPVIVKSHEAVEDALPLGRRNARTIVGDPNLGPFGPRSEPAGDPVAGVAEGVVDQVGEGPGDLISITGDEHRARFALPV